MISIFRGSKFFSILFIFCQKTLCLIFNFLKIWGVMKLSLRAYIREFNPCAGKVQALKLVPRGITCEGVLGQQKIPNGDSILRGVLGTKRRVAGWLEDRRANLWVQCESLQLRCKNSIWTKLITFFLFRDSLQESCTWDNRFFHVYA